MADKTDAETKALERLGQRPSTPPHALAGMAIGAACGGLGMVFGMPIGGFLACALGGTLAGIVWAREKCTIYDHKFNSEVASHQGQ